MSSASEPQKCVQQREAVPAKKYPAYVIFSRIEDEDPEFEGAAGNLDAARDIMRKVLETLKEVVDVFGNPIDGEVFIAGVPSEPCKISVLVYGVHTVEREAI